MKKKPQSPSALEPHPPMEALSEDLLKVLACPDCKGNLSYSRENNNLTCQKCGYLFTVREGIPIMLVEEAQLQIPSTKFQ